jgi:nucleotide-binding universal stress UspA family protein
MSTYAEAGSETLTTGRWYPAGTTKPHGPVVAATDNSPEGDAAFRAAASLAQTWGVGLRVVLVAEPLPLPGPHPDPLLQPLVTTPEMLDELRESAMRRFRTFAPPGVTWTVDVEYGRPSARISEIAREIDASVIVIGLVHHSVLDRLLDGDTALETIRHATQPVLLVPAAWTALPTRALFAVDFSPGSMLAAQAGVRLLSAGGTAVLVHVRPEARAAQDIVFDGSEYELAANHEFDKFIEALDPPPGLITDRVQLRGKVAPVLLSFADSIDADMIVTGTAGAGFVQRLLIGSVATRLVRHSTRSLLVVPGQVESEA